MIKNDFDRVRCPRCRRFYLNKDQVFLDIVNTIIHVKCYTLDTLPIKDRGTYKSIMEKYEFDKQEV